MEEWEKRKTPRHPGIDYDHAGVYFITICTQNRRCVLSRIVGTDVPCPQPSTEAATSVGTVVPDCPQIELTKYGQIVDKYIKQISNYYDHLSVEHYVIMPNHIHLLLLVRNKNTNEGGQSGTPVPTKSARANSTFSSFVSTFKRFCNKEYGENIWQARAYDHIIRDREDYEEHLRYIYENPMRWFYDELYAEE